MLGTDLTARQATYNVSEKKYMSHVGHEGGQELLAAHAFNAAHAPHVPH